jgi:hypothetical protein
MPKHNKKEKKRSDTERENDGDNPETLGDKRLLEAPLSPIISFSETDIAKKRRQEETLEEEEKRKRMRKDALPRSSLSIPDVRLKDDDEKSDDSSESSSEDDKGDAEKHKRVQSDGHLTISSIASKASVVDRLKLLLATSEEEGEEVDNDELLLNLQAIINGSQPLAFSTSQPATDSDLRQLLAALTKAPHNATLVASEDLPNKCMTYPLTMGKIKAYFNRVRALQNSNRPYEENRTQFDEDIEGMIDLLW